jgi:hypothetical protein
MQILARRDMGISMPGAVKGSEIAMEVHLSNFEKLHEQEESLRPVLLGLIEASESRRDHFRLVGEAMSVLHGFTRDHEHMNEEELTIQFLGIRVLNSATVSIKLALSGYYQAAFVHVRDILETAFLIDFLRTNRDKIRAWMTADSKTLQNVFRPFAIRKALDGRDGYKLGNRTKMYRELSEFATHASYRGFRLTSKGDLGEIGGFVDEKWLTAWVEEMAKHLAPCVLNYCGHFDAVRPELGGLREHYATIWRDWIAKYLQGKGG